MPDVVLSNDDLTVLSGPEVIELLVDIGPTGTRGSKVFVGIGNPNSLSGLGQILNDMYINTAPGENYGYLYQYVSEPGGDSWVEVLRLNPTIYSKLQEKFNLEYTSTDSANRETYSQYKKSNIFRQKCFIFDYFLFFNIFT